MAETSKGGMAQELAILRRTIEALGASRQNTRVVFRKATPISLFQGKDSELSEFEDQLEEHWEVYGVESIEDRFRVVWRHLSEKVREEVECYPQESRKTAEGVLSILRRIYGDSRSVVHLLDVFAKVRQQPAESVHQYAVRLNRAFTDLTQSQKVEGQAPLSDQTLRDCFIERLQEAYLIRHLRMKVDERPHLQFIDVMEMAVRWVKAGPSQMLNEDDGAEVVTSASAEVSTSVMEKLLKEVSLLRAEVEDLKCQLSQRVAPDGVSETDAKEKREKPCFGCGLVGHFVRKCPKKGGKFSSVGASGNLQNKGENKKQRGCFRCRKLGHFVKNCPEKRRKRHRLSSDQSECLVDCQAQDVTADQVPGKRHRRRRRPNRLGRSQSGPQVDNLQVSLDKAGERSVSVTASPSAVQAQAVTGLRVSLSKTGKRSVSEIAEGVTEGLAGTGHTSEKGKCVASSVPSSGVSVGSRRTCLGQLAGSSRQSGDEVPHTVPKARVGPLVLKPQVRQLSPASAMQSIPVREGQCVSLSVPEQSMDKTAVVGKGVAQSG